MKKLIKIIIFIIIIPTSFFIGLMISNIINGSSTKSVYIDTITNIKDIINSGDSKTKELEIKYKEAVKKVIEDRNKRGQKDDFTKTDKKLSVIETVNNNSVDLNKCIGCHGTNFEKKALGKSKIVKNMSKKEVSNALIGYKNGTYGGVMKDIMNRQVKNYNIEKLKQTGIGK